MRFITEFELENIVRPDYQYGCKERAKYDMGAIIQGSFEWKEKPFKSHNETESTRWSLEIEAFPMDKWVEFRVELIKHLSYCISVNEPPKALIVLELIKELESFGKPAGEAKELK